jgi:hypothetical protein
MNEHVNVHAYQRKQRPGAPTHRQEQVSQPLPGIEANRVRRTPRSVAPPRGTSAAKPGAPNGGSRSLPVIASVIILAECQSRGSLTAYGGQTAFGSGCALPGCAGNVGGNDVCSVPVQAGPRTVVAHRGARVGVRGGFLHIPQRASGHEKMALAQSP